MPSEITITGAIVAFVLISLIVAGVSLIVTAVLVLHNQATASLEKEALAAHQMILILNGTVINSTALRINFTVKGVSLIPLTAMQVVVRYVNTLNETETYLLDYGSSPGWLLDTIYVGNTTRTLSSGDYLAPGEKAEITIILPTPSSSTQPILVILVSPSGSKGEYALG